MNYHQEARALFANLMPIKPIEVEEKEGEPIAEQAALPEWMGLCLPLDGTNWHYYVDNHYKIYWDVTSKSLKELTLEIDPIDGHSLRSTMTFEQGRGYAVIPLDDVKSVEDFETMNELRLTFKVSSEEALHTYDLQIRKVYLSKFHY